MKFSPSFNQRTITTTAAMALALAAPAFANEFIIGGHEKSVRGLGPARDDRKPGPVADRAGWRRDVFGKLTKEGGQLTGLGKTGTSGPQGPRHADRRNQCDGGPHHHQGQFHPGG
jgi:hypothetical protein